MNDNNGLALVAPRVVPLLDPEFRPAVLANRNFREQVRKSGRLLPVRIALEQTGGSVFHFNTGIFSEDAPQAAGNYTYLERIVKFLLWSRGGWRIYFDGPASMAAKNGGRCSRCISSHVESIVGSFRCASSGEWPLPGKCLAQAESPASCMPRIRAVP